MGQNYDSKVWLLKNLYKSGADMPPLRLPLLWNWCKLYLKKAYGSLRQNVIVEKLPKKNHNSLITERVPILMFFLNIWPLWFLFYLEHIQNKSLGITRFRSLYNRNFKIVNWNYTFIQYTVSCHFYNVFLIVCLDQMSIFYSCDKRSKLNLSNSRVVWKMIFFCIIITF